MRINYDYIVPGGYILDSTVCDLVNHSCSFRSTCDKCTARCEKNMFQPYEDGENEHCSRNTDCWGWQVTCGVNVGPASFGLAISKSSTSFSQLLRARSNVRS